MSEEEDQVRWQNALLLALHQLQDRMHLHPGREEAKPSQRVCLHTCKSITRLNHPSAKYIEGLENRLGRMESLLKLSGLLNEDDGDRTDLGTLERRLADKTRYLSNGDRSSKSPSASDGFSQPRESIESPHLASPDNDRENRQDRRHSRQSQQSPRPTPRSPDTVGEKETEVEALSDMMCSLVTNNCGETRYIGRDSLLAFTKNVG